jgi:hypothetical protein
MADEAYRRVSQYFMQRCPRAKIGFEEGLQA